MIKWIALGVGVLVIAAAGAGSYMWYSHAKEVTSQDQAAFLKSEMSVQDKYQADLKLGYTPQQLSSILPMLKDVEKGAPTWAWEGNHFYAQKNQELNKINAALTVAEINAWQEDKTAMDLAATKTSSRIKDVGDLGTDPVDITPLQTSMDALNKTAIGAKTPNELIAASKAYADLFVKVDAVAVAQKAENDAIAASAAGIVASGGNWAQDANNTLSNARNDATVATFLNNPDVGKPTRALERYATKLGGSEASLGAAGVNRFAGVIHQIMLTALGHKGIVMSYAAQELWAYQDGKIVMDVPITMGHPPNLSTDIGAMKVLYKESPFKMHSPWPKSSPYWYPDTMVKQVVWFTVTGEGMHDAVWEPYGAYGAGSQYGPSSSHGCVHLRDADENYIFNWTDIGQNVVVIPGDGSTVASQQTQVSVDANGDPTSGPKGA